MYNPTPGATRCLTCPSVQYQEAPEAPSTLGVTTTAGWGATHKDDCGCFRGSYGVFSNTSNHTCIACPTGTICEQPNTKLTELPLQANYWRAHKYSTIIWDCLSSGACLGGNATCSDAFCSITSESAGCAPGHTGPFCENCVPNHYKASGTCLECKGDGGQLALLAIPTIALVLVIFACLGYICYGALRRKRRAAAAATQAEEHASEVGDDVGDATVAESESAAKAAVKSRFGRRGSKRSLAASRLCAGWQVDGKILVALAQVTGALSLTFSISYPPLYSTVLRWLNIFKLDVFEVMPLSCHGFGFSFHSSLLLRTIVPLALFTFSLVWKCTLGRCGATLSLVGDSLLTVTFFLVFLLYPTTSQMIFSTFNCVEFDDPSRTRVLRQDLTIDCKTPFHQFMTIYSGIMTLVYPIGVPLGYLYLLSRLHGPTLRLMRKNEEMRADLRSQAVSSIMLDRRVAALTAREDNMRALTLDEQVPPTDVELPADVQAKMAELEKEQRRLHASLPDYIKKLISGYRAVRFDFEILECVRKLALVCMPVIFPPGSNAQLIFGLMVCFLTFGVCKSARSVERSTMRTPARSVERSTMRTPLTVDQRSLWRQTR